MSLLLAAAQNADAPVLVAQNVAFGIIAAMMVFGAIRVVTTSNVVHAAVYLVMVLAGAAAQFILLGAEFVAVTQVMVYIGAIVVLFLFGIMLTRAPMQGTEKPSRDNWIVGLGTSLTMLCVLIYVLVDGFSGDKLPADLMPTDTRAVSDAIFSVYLVPFEVISVLLLAALIGAIVIARRD
ncbi:MAG: NADH-quinone oxidoreductase subunit J [Microthrixaceae bacterium]|nr:NADH-quinone oxidoreductase subunit J [Acidimicrobiales bacterium]MCB9404385.1 NADH-quinone oxidoreductase subunit J [Microthrixaceae bacterium]